MTEELTLIEAVGVAEPQPALKQQSEVRAPPINIMQIRREIEGIKQKNEQRKRQLHELFSHSYDELEGAPVKRPPRYMDTITERKNIKKRQQNVSLDAGRSRKLMVQPRHRINNPEGKLFMKTVRHLPQTTQESEARSHRYS